MELEKKSWQIKAVQLGYVLGLSLIIAAIIYFFASNWPGLAQGYKVTLSISLMIFFYGMSFLITRIFKKQPFLSSLFLFLGCLSFGIGIALIGQIYNSHADSFMMFIIWAIPSVILAIITKYQPFYVLSFILFHLSVWFYLFPSSSFQFVPELQLKVIFLCLAFINGLLYAAIERRLLSSKPVQLLSFIVMHGIMLALTIDELFAPFNIFSSFLYVVILFLFYMYYGKYPVHKGYTLLLSLAAVAFFTIKFIEFLIFMGSEYIFLFTMLLPFVIVAIVIWGLRKWKGNKVSENHFDFRRIIIGLTTAIASIIASSSIYGVTFLMTHNFSFPFFVVMGILLIVIALLRVQWDSIIRYTFLLTGYFVGIPAAIGANVWMATIFCLFLSLALWKINNTIIRYFIYLGIMVVIVSTVAEVNYSKELVVWTVIILNGLVYLGSILARNQHFRQKLNVNSVFYGMLAFFVLTFLNENHAIMYYLINSLYFILTTLLLIYFMRHTETIFFRLMLAFWFAFLIYKYYDLVWGLLHKSFTFLLTGMLILFIARWLDNSNEQLAEKLKYSRKVSIIMVIVFQVIVVGIQIGTSERLLANGQLIKLELAPVDPRSMLQGDYLTLRYSISSLDLNDEDLPWRQRIRVGLVRNAQGVYEYSGDYIVGTDIPADRIDQADVWITGILKGYENIEYGIENYFVPEGTGLELQEKVHYAFVRVATNGDSLLVKLTEE
ncbi:GDYXXLXY domain-containing protein [Bacillus sp. Marseille-P3661]|uniref:GDYXXLXY domain-containing protein n=1 Tax=Bacillus sp. Marseille-P3661 TaxID=1936234 RepID=UPI000C84C13D|nr:GDYXXLXY domain-containing protein [Bacillus sp. Marseille-P3661]